ncbi:hypothetical protein U0070_018080 [Myodes glareolus]|uniref:Uncharacterized protein n=1 Tax=Myodes glareolus TaxID=447135 RepID=A0AAW0GXL5_MYOGA
MSITNDRLQSPQHFLQHLAFVDTCYISGITLTMLQSLVIIASSYFNGQMIFTVHIILTLFSHAESPPSKDFFVNFLQLVHFYGPALISTSGFL